MGLEFILGDIIYHNYKKQNEIFLKTAKVWDNLNDTLKERFLKKYPDFEEFLIKYQNNNKDYPIRVNTFWYEVLIDDGPGLLLQPIKKTDNSNLFRYWGLNSRLELIHFNTFTELRGVLITKEDAAEIFCKAINKHGFKSNVLYGAPDLTSHLIEKPEAKDLKITSEGDIWNRKHNCWYIRQRQWLRQC